uniref:VGF nerve growth factor inducible n=1 Tax=Erpetoichthys calabaricus TaxID=27687 RepID=A0A8C4SF53_ERPCA
MVWSKHTASAVFLLILTLVNLQYVSLAPVALEIQEGHMHESPPANENVQHLDIKSNQEKPQENGKDVPERGKENDRELQIRSLSYYPGTKNSQSNSDELFKDIDPKTLAAVLLEALNENQGAGQEQKEGEALAELAQQQEAQRRDEDRLTENVKSHTWAGSATKMRGEDGPQWKRQQQQLAESSKTTEEQGLTPQELENLQVMLKELQKFSTATKRERAFKEPNSLLPLDRYTTEKQNNFDSGENDILKELAAYEELVGSQHVKGAKNKEEREVPQRGKNKPMTKFFQGFKDYDSDEEAEAEEEEVRRQVAEAEKAREEEEKLTDMASDLLLQYLLKQEGTSEDKDNHGKEEGYQDESKKSLELTEEEQEEEEEERRGEESDDNAAEDKRSNEENGEEGGDDIDPQTIDKLIEISSKLHLPADDVIDIINDVEKKKKDAPERAEPKHHPTPKDHIRAPSAPQIAQPQPVHQHQKQKSIQHMPASMYYPKYPPQRSRHHINTDISLSNRIDNNLDYDEIPMAIPRRYHPKQAQQITFSNYIRPRTYQPPFRRQYYYPPRPALMQREDYYDETQDNEEELENFIEKILFKHPEVFQ